MARVIALLVFALSLNARVLDAADDTRSSALASELSGLLSTAKLDAVAAVDPDSPDRFVAVLAFPQVQFLVVDGSVTATALVVQQIAAKQYREVYLALQQSANAHGRIFVHDMGADGLQKTGGDVLYESGVKQIVFDGEPRPQKLSDAAYQKRFEETDRRYSRMLSLLGEQLKRVPSP